MKSPFALLGISFVFWIGLVGCFTSPTPPQRPTAADPSPADSLLEIESSYRNGKFLEALNIANTYLKKNPGNPEALFFQGLIYYKTNDLEQTKMSFAKISPEERSLLAESCLELRELNTTKSKEVVHSLASTYFPDCLAELSQPDDSQESLSFSKEQVMRYGRFYDEVMQKEDDPEIRRMKEEAFLKEYQLTEEQLGEITSRYLDYLADDKE